MIYVQIYVPVHEEYLKKTFDELVIWSMDPKSKTQESIKVLFEAFNPMEKGN